MNRRTLLALALGLATLAGCAAPADPRQAELDRTFEFAKRTLLAAGRDAMAAMSLQSALEMGATPVDYLAASAPDDADFVEIVWDGPPKPWCVLLREAPGDADYTLSAYAADGAVPTRTETITVEPVPPP
jgi:hypothetical protein